MAGLFNLDEETSQRVISATREGRYSLLLGAGFSATSTDRNGRPLPLGNALADEIALKYGMPTGYPLAQLSSALDGKINDWLTQRFSDCTPSQGVLRVPQFVWRHIFTFNIDDALHAAFQSRTSARQQEPAYLTHLSAYEPPDWPEEVPVVHLHGSVRQPEDGYIFSLREYALSISMHSTWFHILGDLVPLITSSIRVTRAA